jgi:glyoxylase I family protein
MGGCRIAAEARRMPATGFNHYNLRAPRKLLDELRDFYCSVIGLTQGARPPFESFGYWLYAGDRAILHLSESRPDEVRATGVATTFDHAAFACTDFAEMQTRLKRHNVEYEVNCVPLTKQRQLFLQDPAGNGVELNFADD